MALILTSTPDSPYPHVLNMKDGEIGIIRECATPYYKGRVVQRYKNALVSLGLDSMQSFPDIFMPTNTEERIGKFQVEVLPEGTTFQLL